MNDKISHTFRSEMKRYMNEKSEKKLFSSMQNYSDLQFMMQEFLMGVVQATPWHLGPVDKETIPLLDDLRKINALGMITVESQPGLVDKKYNIAQRSYLEAIVPKYIVHTIGYMLKNTDVLMVVYDRRGDMYHAYLKGHMYEDTKSLIDQLKEDKEDKEDDLVYGDHVAVTYEDGKVYTSIPLNGFDELYPLEDYNKDILNYIIEHCARVVFIDLKLGRPGLFKLMYRVMSKINPQQLEKTTKIKV